MVIIGILATIGTISYNSLNKDARDTAKIQDLKVISSLLENELSLGKDLPEPFSANGVLGEKTIDGKSFKVGIFSGDKIKDFFKEKLSKLPETPEGGMYIYALRDDKKKYVLQTTLENGDTYNLANFIDNDGLLASNITKKKIFGEIDTSGNHNLQGVPDSQNPKKTDNGGGIVTKEYIDNCFDYSERSDRIMIRKFLSSCGETKIIIPETINGKPVVQILERAFEDSDITSISLPQTITHIGSYAFKNVPATGDLNLPNLTNLGTEAFYNGQFTSMNFPKLKNIKVSALRGNNKLKSLTLGIKSIPDNFFESDDISGELNLPNATTIGNNAFRNNKLTSLNLPNVTSIGNNSFSNNKISGELRLPSSITSIGDSVFSQNNITSINLPSSITSIGDSVFSQNNITSINLPSSITSIGSYAFSNNKISGELSLPSSITSIGSYAFSNNKISGELSLPSSITSIGYDAFSDNKIERANLESFEYDGNTSIFGTNPLTYLKLKNKEPITIDKSIINVTCESNTLKKIYFIDGTEVNRGLTPQESLITNITGIKCTELDL